MCSTDDPWLVRFSNLVGLEGQEREAWECKENVLLILLSNLSTIDWPKRYLSVGRQAAMMAAPDSIIDQKRIRLTSSNNGQ